MSGALSRTISGNPPACRSAPVRQKRQKTKSGFRSAQASPQSAFAAPPDPGRFPNERHAERRSRAFPFRQNTVLPSPSPKPRQDQAKAAPASKKAISFLQPSRRGMPSPLRKGRQLPARSGIHRSRSCTLYRAARRLSTAIPNSRGRKLPHAENLHFPHLTNTPVRRYNEKRTSCFTSRPGAVPPAKVPLCRK